MLKKKNNIKLGIQISHSGRKGSSHIPWEKYNSPLKGKNSWQTYAPSVIKRDDHWPSPKKITLAKIKKLIEYYKKSAILANKSGFDCLEIHMSHVYLLHQFFYAISNKRDDNYGGNLQNRSRLLIEIASSIRKVWPKNKILGARITGSDHLKKGVNIKDSIYLINKLKKEGVDYFSVSSGGILPKTKMKKGEAFRAKMTKKIKSETNVITTTTGEITKFTTVEKLIKSKTLDFITIARPIIKNPNWILHLAKYNKKNDLIPKQYSRII